MDKDVQRLLKAIAGQGEPFPSALGLGIYLLEISLYTKELEGGTDNTQ